MTDLAQSLHDYLDSSNDLAMSQTKSLTLISERIVKLEEVVLNMGKIVNKLAEIELQKREKEVS